MIILTIKALVKTQITTYHFSYAIKDRVYNLLANGVVTTGIVVRCILFATD